MAKIQMDLPLSGRLNIVKWLEGFRHSGYGLKQAAIDYFDQGNDYNTNAKVTDFNKTVKIFVDSMKIAGLVAGDTPRGRYSITSKMLEKFKYEHISDKLKAFLFDSDLATVKFDDSNAAKVMEALYQKNKNIEFNNLVYFENFAVKGNVSAMLWLVEKYGTKNYSLNGNKMGGIFTDMIENTNFGEDKTVDFFIKTGILKETLDYKTDDYPSFLMRTKLSKSGFEKILPLTNFNESRFLSSYSTFDFLNRLHLVDPSLLKLCNITKDSWIEFADYTIGKISVSDFKNYESFIRALIETSPLLLEYFLTRTGWSAYNKFLELIPGVRDIFIF